MGAEAAGLQVMGCRRGQRGGVIYDNDIAAQARAVGPAAITILPTGLLMCRGGYTASARKRRYVLRNSRPRDRILRRMPPRPLHSVFRAVVVPGDPCPCMLNLKSASGSRGRCCTPSDSLRQDRV